jgi:SAM-dependent methyltransferase
MNNQENKKKVLKDLTTDFYQKIANEFDATRHYQWTGWGKLAEYFKDFGVVPSSVLDVACGNGRFIDTLLDISSEFSYLGIDNNRTLLRFAKKKYGGIDKNRKIIFRNIDIYSDWELNKKYDLIVVFGITHHLVNAQVRIEFFSKISKAIAERGLAVVSFWDFLSDKKLQKKIVTKEQFLKSGISGEDPMQMEGINLGIFDSLRQNDYILDWKKSQTAYRFCHYYTQEEIEMLFSQSGLKIVNRFSSDGPNQKANQYFVLQKI